MTVMPPLELLTCIVCVARVHPASDEAKGWVYVQNRVDEGDENDDAQWRCPAHVYGDDL